MDTELTLPLKTPIDFAGEKYTELKLSEPTAEQLIAAGKLGSPIESVVTLIQLNAKIPKGVAALLRQRDIEAAGDFFGRFNSGPPPTSVT